MNRNDELLPGLGRGSLGVTEVVTFELGFDKMKRYPCEKEVGAEGMTFGRGNTTSRSAEMPVWSGT